MGGKKPKKRKSDDVEKEPTDTSDSECSVDEQNKYEPFRITNYIRLYPEDGGNFEYLIIYESEDPKKPIGERDLMSLGNQIKRNNKGVKRFKRINKYKIGAIFERPGLANLAINNVKFLKDQKIKATIPAAFTEVTGVIRNVPVYMSNKEIYKGLSSSKDIVSVRRFMRRERDLDGNYNMKPTLAVSITFACPTLPESVDINSWYFEVENIVKAYKSLSRIPSIAGGKLNNAGNRVTSKWSVRNLDKWKNTKYTYNYFLNDDLKSNSESDFGSDVTNEILSSVSPKETFKAVIRDEKDSKDVKKQYLEVWKKNQLLQCFDLNALDIHGNVYADTEFGSLDWSQDETAVVYIAEKKLQKSEPYIKRKGAEDKAKNEGSGETPVKKGEEYVYRQDWGEQLAGKYYSVIVVCRPLEETFTVLEGIPESWCPGQVSFAPDGKSVVGTAWETHPRRLGLIFCTNRPSFIFQLTLDGQLTKLSKAGAAVRSPRPAPDGRVFWLQREAVGPHHACHALIVANKNEVRPVIDIVQTEAKTVNNESFYGIYSLGLPSRCFASDDRLVFSTPQQNEVRSYVVDADGKRIVDISNKSFQCSTSVLDVKNDVVLATCSSMTTPGELFIAKLPGKGKEADIKWIKISENTEAPEIVKNSTVEYLQLTHEGSSDSVKSFTALYFAPKSTDAKLPLIVWPHGGPHSGYVNAFSLEAALFSSLGLASVRVNFRGSIGQGDSNVHSLIGQLGVYDVQDCLLALSTVLDKDKRLDKDCILLYGGSYGGFTVGHLAGRFPSHFKAVVMRNPLIDLATKGQIADNSDGCAVEFGYNFTEAGPVLEEQLLSMRRSSPLAHVHKVKAATCLMLGSIDKRVPHYQGLEFARRLAANAVETKIYMYEDNHSLSSLPAEMDNLINGAKWFLDHI